MSETEYASLVRESVARPERTWTVEQITGDVFADKITTGAALLRGQFELLEATLFVLFDVDTGHALLAVIVVSNKTRGDDPSDEFDRWMKQMKFALPPRRAVLVARASRVEGDDPYQFGYQIRKLTSAEKKTC